MSPLAVGLLYLKEEGILMPKTLRRIMVCTLSVCALVMMGFQPVVASVGSPHAHKAAVVSTKNTKAKKSLCDLANSARKGVIKKFTKIYVAEHGKKIGKKRARDLPGRDICLRGMRGGKKPSNGDKARYLRTLNRLKAPPAVATTTVVVPAQPAGTSQSAVAPPSSGGTYCGLFQFDQQTWESVGGSGSPCAASSSEQWQRAQALQQQRGNQPWPVCGANGASLEAIMRCESGGNPSIAG